jgi:hypothetical protein
MIFTKENQEKWDKAKELHNEKMEQSTDMSYENESEADNPKFPIFMTNPVRIKTIETYKEGNTPMTKLKGEKNDDDFLVDLLKEKHENQSKT